MLNLKGFDKVLSVLNERLRKYDSSIEVATTPEGTRFPLVVVTDIENQSVNRTYGGIESYSVLSIQVDIYARQKTFKNITYSGRNITRKIACEVDYILTECGLKRTSSRAVQNADRSIDRYVMTYTVLQNDNKNYFV